jgi:hypothetical protein
MECVRQEKTRKDYPPREYLIFFIERPDRNWWDYVFLTREGFRHCFVMQWCEWSQRWIMVDWRQSTTDFIVLFDFEAEQFIRNAKDLKGTVVRFEARQPPDSGKLVSYCSNVISRFLGLGDSLILTPYGLYRRLLKSGGEVVFTWSNENEQQAQANRAAEAA